MSDGVALFDHFINKQPQCRIRYDWIRYVEATEYLFQANEPNILQALSKSQIIKDTLVIGVLSDKHVQSALPLFLFADIA